MMLGFSSHSTFASAVENLKIVQCRDAHENEREATNTHTHPTRNGYAGKKTIDPNLFVLLGLGLASQTLLVHAKDLLGTLAGQKSDDYCIHERRTRIDSRFSIDVR